MNDLLPRSLVGYIHQMGVRALDHLAANTPQPPAGDPDGATPPNALQNLANQWRLMSDREKEQFVTGIEASVVEVVAASTLLPAGLKLGRKAVKSAKKVIKRQAKTLKKKIKKAGATKTKGKETRAPKPKKVKKAGTVAKKVVSRKATVKRRVVARKKAAKPPSPPVAQDA